MPDLPQRFAGWVRDGRLDTGMKVRKLPKILDAKEAVRLLEVDGFDAAEEYLAERNPREQEMYLLMERARARLAEMSVVELVEAKQSAERVEILEDLRQTVTDVLDNIGRVGVRETGRKAGAGRRRR